jgi:hypothetical protein
MTRWFPGAFVALGVALGGCMPAYDLGVKDASKVSLTQTVEPSGHRDFAKNGDEIRMSCAHADPARTIEATSWAAHALQHGKPDDELRLECVPVEVGVGTTILTTPVGNVTRLEREVPWGRIGGAWLASMAAIPATICTVGALTANADERRGAWTCAGVSVGVAVLGVGLALLNPTTRASVNPAPRPSPAAGSWSTRTGHCQCTYRPGDPAPVSCQDPRCGPVDWR